ncbi:MAG TPA: tRNA pseudouridine(38-40) synthase TruA [Dehalococcoidia bacterium]|nr:tRNA pseudouridine(38-40) synthase TruA [Dehalococcoidia bacterium]
MTSQKPVEGNQRRIALLLEYDGSCYGGSQIQKNAPTIQGGLEGAIGKLTGETAHAAFAGRTDAGVHARGQVASFLTRRPFDATVFVDGLNYWLPDDIAVRAAREVALDFDVRRRARRRLYRYLVHDDRAPSPLMRERAWHVKERLDAAAMQQAAACLVGRHDFAAFAGRVENSPAGSVRTMHRFDVRRVDRMMMFEAEADAFLPHQVRRTVGALVEVGLRRQTPKSFEALLQTGGSATAGPAAPPQGLCLIRVTYPDLDFDEETDSDEDLQC